MRAPPPYPPANPCRSADQREGVDRQSERVSAGPHELTSSARRGGRARSPRRRGRRNELGRRGPGPGATEILVDSTAAGVWVLLEISAIDEILSRSLLVLTARTATFRVPTVITPRGSSRNVRYQLRGLRLHERTKTRSSTTTAQMPTILWSPTPARTPMIWLVLTASTIRAGKRRAALPSPRLRRGTPGGAATGVKIASVGLRP